MRKWPFRVIIFHYFSALPYIQLYMFAAVKYNQMIPAMLTIMSLSQVYLTLIKTEF